MAAIVGLVAALLVVAVFVAITSSGDSKGSSSPAASSRSLLDRCYSELLSTLQTATGEATFNQGVEDDIYPKYGAVSPIADALVQLDGTFEAQVEEFGSVRANAVLDQAIISSCHSLIAAGDYPYDPNNPAGPGSSGQ